MADTPTNIPANTQIATEAGVSQSAPTTGNPQLKTEPATAEQKAQEAFARKERQLRKMQQDLQAEKQAWQAKMTEYETGYVPKSRIKEDPWSVLNEAEVNYDKLTEQLMSMPTDPVTKAMHAKIKELEAKQQASEKAAMDASTQQYQQALKQIGQEVRLLVDSEAEAYQTIKEMDAYEAVTELIERDFNETGVLKDVADAAQEVEAYLVEEFLRGARLKKIQDALKPKTEETVTGTGAPADAAPIARKKYSNGPSITPRTLTNSMSAGTAKTSSEKDRIARAIAVFNGKAGG